MTTHPAVASLEDSGSDQPPVSPRAAESQVRAALELMPQLVWTTTPDGYHDYYNQRWYDFTGMPRPDDPTEDAEGWNWNRYLHPDDYERTVAVWTHCLATGDPYQIEYRFKERATGSYRWFLARALPLRNEDGHIVRWFGTCTDIHDDRMMRERLLESEERFRNSTRYSAIGHAIVSLEGRFVQVNPALAKLFGRTEEDLISQRFQDITHPDDLQHDLGELRRLVAGEIDSYCMDKRYLHASGRAVWAQLNVSAVRDAAGAALYFISQIQDLSERRSLERQLRQAGKLEALGRLAGGIAHDFNNLLGAIMGYTELLRSDLGDSPARTDVEGIRAAAERGARLTAQLLTFGRRHLRRVTEVDLGAAVDEAASLVRQLAGPHIQVLIESEPDTHVRVDPSEVDQIIINLVVNARDAMPSGGSLYVTVASKVIEAASGSEGQAAPLRPGPYVELTVTDTGCGIPDDVLARIFEPFFSTKQDAGAGLGLSTLYGIVHESGGTVAVDTEVGRGTRMTVTLPRDTAAVTTRAPERTITSQPHDTRTVLLVEDEGALREVCRRVLERAGHTVIVARHGRDGLARWEEFHARIDLIVTDLVMPELGGRDMVASIHEARPDLPVIFMSGYTDDEVTRRALEEPDIAFLAKPFAPEALLAAVQVCARRRG